MTEVVLMLKKLKKDTLQSVLESYPADEVTGKQHVCTMGPKLIKKLGLTDAPRYVKIKGAKEVQAIVEERKDGFIGMSLNLRKALGVDEFVDKEIKFNIKNPLLGKKYLEFAGVA
jgi:hypothetical protein